MVSGYYPEEQGTLVLSAFGPDATTPPVVNVSPISLTFASQAVGTTSNSQSLTFTFPNGPVNKLATSIMGDYSYTTTCGTLQAQGSSCTAAITFAPTAAGARNGTFTITSNASNSTLNVPLTGTGTAPSVTLTPANAQFAGVVGSTTPEQVFTFTNNSGGSLTVSNVSVSGDYLHSSACGSVANGATCTINVSLRPTQTGVRNGTLILTHDGPGGSTAVPLTGSGVDFNVSISRPTRTRRSSAQIVVVAGQSRALDLHLSTSGTATGTIAIGCEGARAILQCSATPRQLPITDGVQSFRLNLSAGSRMGVRPGIYTVRATARYGEVTRAVEFTVEVRKPVQTSRLSRATH
jgi:hypothetical protein